MCMIGELVYVVRTSLAGFLTYHIIRTMHGISCGVKLYLRFVLIIICFITADWKLFLNKFCSSNRISKASFLTAQPGVE